jgi:hypothetical protein
MKSSQNKIKNANLKTINPQLSTKKTTRNQKTALKTVETHQKCPKMDKNTRKKARHSMNLKQFTFASQSLAGCRSICHGFSGHFRVKNTLFGPFFTEKGPHNQIKTRSGGKSPFYIGKCEKNDRSLEKNQSKNEKKKKKKKAGDRVDNKKKKKKKKKKKTKKKKKKKIKPPSHTFKFFFFFMFYFQIQFPPFAEQNGQ